MDTYWYAREVGETFWVMDCDEEKYRVCSEDCKWIDIADCVDVVDGSENIIDIKEARVLQRVANIFSTKPDTFERFDLPVELMESYKDFIDAKNKLNDILKEYGFEELL